MEQFRAAPAAAPVAAPAPIDRLLQDSSLYLLGNIASRLVGFLAIPFYSRFLTPAQYGLIELIELSTQTIAIALGLQAIGAALSRLFFDQKTAEGEREVVSTSLIATAVLSAVVTIAAIAGSGQLSLLVFHTDEWANLLRAAFLAMFLSNMIEVVLVYERMRDHARFFLAYTLITLAATLGLNILFIGVFDFGVWGFVSSKLLVCTLGCLFLFFRVQRDVGFVWRGQYVPELVRFGAPLVLSSLSYFAIHFSDRFFLSSAVSLAELGRYALAYRFAILVSALVGDSFAKSWNVTLYRYIDRADWREQFARVAAYFTYILFVTALGIALFSPELLRVMVPKTYFPPPLLLPIIIVSYLAREIGDFFRTLLLINKRSGLVGRIAAGGAVLNIAANIVLIPRFGIYGAAIATFITWFAYMVVAWAVANGEHRLPVNTVAYLRLTVLLVAIYTLATLSRVHSIPVQLVLTTAWIAAFMLVAFGIFFAPAERRGALGLVGSLLLRGASFVLPSGRFVQSEGVGEAGGAVRRVLMLAYYYPPQNEIGAARPFRFARYLSRGGTAVSVVTAAPRFAGAEDETDVVRVSGPRTGARPGQQYGAAAASRPVRVIAGALHAAERMFLPYEDRLGWFPHAYSAAVGRLHPGTVLFSTHPPTVTHLTAMALKARFGLPWIADFRDPLWGNPYRTSQRAGVMDPLLERMTVENADAVIANTDASAALLRERYPDMRDKIHVIWNGFDPEDGLVPGPRVSRRRRAIAHVGTLYGTRTPLPFLLSLERLIQQGLLDPETIQFRQVGRADPGCLNLGDPVMETLALRGCCHIVNHNVPIREAREEMLDAEWLLLLDMQLVNPGLQVPAKLYEYARTGRPILALTVPGSSTERVLAISGVTHTCIDINAAPEVFDAGVLAFLLQPATSSVPSAAFWAEFEAPHQVRSLVAIIDRIRGAAPG